MLSVFLFLCKSVAHIHVYCFNFLHTSLHVLCWDYPSPVSMNVRMYTWKDMQEEKMPQTRATNIIYEVNHSHSLQVLVVAWARVPHRICWQSYDVQPRASHTGYVGTVMMYSPRDYIITVPTYPV